jgi:hydroxymethylpyrimidine/phosphomethylpyrimidine kinase
VATRTSNQNARRHGLIARELTPPQEAQAQDLAQHLLADCSVSTPELEEAALLVARQMTRLAAIRQAITEEINRRALEASPEARFNT